MATYTIAPSPWLIFLDDDGIIVPNGQLAIYDAGTTTPATVYKTSSGAAHAFPIDLDGAGRIPMGLYLVPGNSYKFELYGPMTVVDLDGPLIKTQDNVAAVPLSASNSDVLGVLGESGASGDVFYLSDGSGGKNAGQWYKTDSTNDYSSSLPEIGLLVNDALLADTGTFRLLGQLTVPGPLVIGDSYYVSATPGVLSTTAPAINARFVAQADSSSSLVISADPPPPTVIRLPLDVVEGRLTATSGVPVTVSDVNGATSIFFCPYKGNRIALYDGVNWAAYTFTQITISLVGLTASKPYDIFAFVSGTTVTIETLVWTNTTTRATNLTTQDGVLVKTGAVTRRYLGTVYINGSGGQTDDTIVARFIWNYYNRDERTLLRMESTDNWSYTTAAYRQVRADTANKVSVIVGWQEATMALTAYHAAANTNGVDLATSIGDNSTTAPATGVMGMNAQTLNANIRLNLQARLVVKPTVGYHDYNWLEYSTATGTTTWYGDAGTPTLLQTGLVGTIEG